MNDDPDIVTRWTLRRGSDPGRTRFHLACEIEAEFVEPTRDEIRTALTQILDEALGPADLFPTGTDTTVEISGWDDTFINAASRQSELEQLRTWKAEALPLLDILERCHAALPGHARAPLGASKAQAVYDWIYDRPIIDEDD